MDRCIYVLWMKSLEWVIVVIMTEWMRQDLGWPHDHELDWVGLYLATWLTSVAEYMWVWMGACDEQMQDIDKEKLLVCCCVHDNLEGSKLGLIYKGKGVCCWVKMKCGWILNVGDY